MPCATPPTKVLTPAATSIVPSVVLGKGSELFKSMNAMEKWLQLFKFWTMMRCY